MNSYTMSIQFLALKPIVKLFSREMVTFTPTESCYLNHENIGHSKLPQTNLRKNKLDIMLLLLVHL
jgi:hypothetical protein